MTALPSPEAKADVVERMFDRLAPRYDRLNRTLTFGQDQRWRRALLDRCQVKAGDRVLDLACGTGDLANLAYERGADAVGLDFAAGMLELARERSPFDLPFVRGDALALPFPDNAFDAAVSGFAIRNFTELDRVFAELARVVRPGGHLGLLEIDVPPSRLLRFGHGVYFGRLVPLVGGALSGDRQAYRYLVESAAYLPQPQELGRMLREAGFPGARKRRHMGGAIQTVVAVRA